MNDIDNYLNGKFDGEEKPPVVPNKPSTIGVLNTENKTYDGQTTGTYNNPIIPKGFAPINENGAEWGTEEGYKYGLVITDGESTGNEFVWVPVDETNVTFERYDFGKGNVTFSSSSETLPNEINSSINRNGGFYIARYEAGIAEGMTKLTSDSTGTYGGGAYKPVSKKDAIVWNYIQWGTNADDDTPGNGAVTVARSMYQKEDDYYGAVSTLIYGVQWDTALKFIQACDIGEEGYSTYATNSAEYGNYFGTNDKGDTFASTTEPTTCGAAPQFRQKNIYDMAGNVLEWTMEATSSDHVTRGGAYYSASLDCPASYRYSYSVGGTNPGIGFRCVLYIKAQTES